MIVKIFWFLRRIIHSLINPNISPYGYTGKPLFILGFWKLRFEKKTRILPHSRFECHGKDSRIIVKANTSIGQNFHCTAIKPLYIGGDTVISGNVCITNIDHDYSQIGKPILDQDHLYSETVIGQNCFIGFGAIIQAGTKLGNNCIVGANSVVRGDFPEGSVIVGSPAKIVKKWDQENKEWISVKRK